MNSPRRSRWAVSCIVSKLADPQAFFEKAFARAHDAIHRYARERGLPEIPRTVIVACVVQEGIAWWNHVGDARLYLVRDGRIEKQTKDHTQVQTLVDAGEISPDQAYSHPQSTRMLQSLGGPTAPEPDPCASALLHKNDILLLCSDGFWGPLRTSQLLMGLEGPSLRQCILELSDTAERRAGAHADNLAVLALRWQDETVACNETRPGSGDNSASRAAGGGTGFHRPDPGIG